MTNIKKYRLLAELTQEQLADKLNVAQSSVAEWEAGRSFPMAKRLKEIAAVLNCTVDDLIGGDDA